MKLRGTTRRISGRFRWERTRNFVWGFVSQGSSSLTNLALSVVAARQLGPSGLGSVFVGFTYYLLALGFQRALVNEPLVAGTSAIDMVERKLATKCALTVSMIWAIGTGLLLVVIGLAFQQSMGTGLLAFAPWIIPALIQDLWRAVLFRDGRGSAGALNDAVWLAAMGCTLPIALTTRSTWLVVSWWGFGALAGMAVGIIQNRISPRSPATALGWWWRNSWPLAKWLAAGGIVYMLGPLLLVFLLAIVLGTRPLGGLRAVQSLFAPLSLLAPAIALPGLPALSRRAARSLHEARALAVQLAMVLPVVTAAYVAIASLGNGQLLSLVFGESFNGYTALIVPVGVGQILLAATISFNLLLKAENRGRSLFVGGAVSSVSMLILGLGLGAAYGVVGAAWGTTLGSAAGSIVLVAYALKIPARPLGPEPGRASIA